MSNSLDRLLGGSPGRTLLKLVVASIVIGFVLATVGLDPVTLIRRLVRGFDQFVDYLYYLGSDTFVLLGRYLLYGAVIVVPVWLVLRLIAVGRGRA